MIKLVQVGLDNDITEHINPKSYSMNSEDQYESWEDGNYVEHRIYVRKKIRGTFEVALYGKNGMDFAAFKQIWDDATENDVALLNVWVQNENRLVGIYAYYKFTGTIHREMLNGQCFDKITVEVTER